MNTPVILPIFMHTDETASLNSLGIDKLKQKLGL